MKMRTLLWHVGMLNEAASFIQYAILHSILRLLDAIGMRAAMFMMFGYIRVRFGFIRLYSAGLVALDTRFGDN